MNQTELQAMLKSIEVARGTAEGAVAQLHAIEVRLKSLLGGGDSYATSMGLRSPGEVKQGSQDLSTRPENYDYGILATLPCPKCNAAMVWRWSRANNEWFAGCTEFAGNKSGCRGSRSFASVFSGHAKAAPSEPLRTEPLPAETLPVEPMHITDGPTWTADDLERIEKHHGPEAAKDVIPF